MGLYTVWAKVLIKAAFLPRMNAQDDLKKNKNFFKKIKKLWLIPLPIAYRLPIHLGYRWIENLMFYNIYKNNHFSL